MNHPIVITGCQRSGTTLLHLILDSHPDIHGIDEDEYEDDRRHDYLHASEFHPNVSFKLPRVGFNLEFVKSFPDVRMLWCVRDPRDVVVSMMDLKLPLGTTTESPQETTTSVSWAAHPHGADYELHFSVPALSSWGRLALRPKMRRYRRIRRKAPDQRSREDVIFTGALVWRVKNALFKAFSESPIPCRIVRYEDVIGRTRREVEDILDFLSVTWHDNALKHHILHSGTSIGDTKNTRPIDESSRGKWKECLTENELSMVADICADTAADFGYDVQGSKKIRGGG